MIRIFAAASGLALLALASGASAQSYAPSWGQPVYVDGRGRPIGGTPLSEVETRSYVDTGRWADGYADRPYVVVPWPAGPRYGHGYGARGHRYGHRARYGYRYDYHRDRDRPYAGYRDEWGYQDDRPRPGRQGYVGHGRRHDRSYDEPYLYDR